MELEQKILTDAIQELDNALGNAGCNDYDLPNTPEALKLWNEYQSWNLGIPVKNIEKHKDYWEPGVSANEKKLHVGDGIWVYLLKKHCGLLKK